MKKRIMAMTIVVALSFLISISAVSTSFSKQAVQTERLGSGLFLLHPLVSIQ